MPVLFRDVRPSWAERPPARVAAVFNDAAEHIWISWPLYEHNGSYVAAVGNPEDILQELDQLEVRLREFALLSMCDCEQHDTEVHLKTHQESWFVAHGWNALPGADADVPDLAALIPERPLLGPVAKVLPELQRRGIELQGFTRTVDTIFLVLKGVAPDPALFPVGSRFLGFPRHYLPLTIVGRGWQLFGEDKTPSPIFNHGDTTGSATFHQIVQVSGIAVFDSVFKIARQEVRHLSGRSFDVTVARAREDSTLPAYYDGVPRRQWRAGSVLAFKRPILIPPSDTITGSGADYISRRGQEGHAAHTARVTRALVNELQILSHGVLRRHPNIIHLFGICWDQTNTGQGYEACPILVQAGADLGNLELYLENIRSREEFTWSLRIDILRQVLTGLRDLHACRIVHSDIKCANILVDSVQGSERPRIMLSDFGFSVAPSSSPDQVEIEGATRRYASPEMSRRMEEKDFSMPLAEAFASDIYSFGLTACAIIFAGKDPFETIVILQDELVSRGLIRSQTSRTAEQLWKVSVTNIPAHAEFMAQLGFHLTMCQTALSQVKPSRLRDSIGHWVAEMLHWSPIARTTDIMEMLNQLQRHVETAEDATAVHTLAMEQTQSTLEAWKRSRQDRLAQQRCELFCIDGQMQEIMITEVSIDSSVWPQMFQKDFELQQQIVDDLRAKASPLIGCEPSMMQSLRLGLGLENWARSAYAAFQVFLCYLHGFGTKQDMSSAARYLAASCRGGYGSAFSMGVRFYQRYPDLRLPDWAPDIEALFELVSLGPWPGFEAFAQDAKVLKELAPERLRAAVDRVRSSAFSELGEDHINLRDHDEESFRGPDIEYQWFPIGSIALFQRLISHCDPSQLLSGFRSGLFPTEGRNYNNETALYMCCRIGAVDAVLGLAKELPWFCKQAVEGTHDGRTPLHCLHNFKREDVGRITAFLLENGADLNAVDKFGRRAVDDAISSGREDVVFHLLNQQPPLFTSHWLWEKDIATASKSLICGSAMLLEHCLQKSDLDAKINILGSLSSTAFETRILCATFQNLPRLLQSVGRLTDDELAKVEDGLFIAMAGAILHGNSDILTGVVDHILPSSGLSSESMIKLLTIAAKRSHIPDFEVALTTSTAWTLDNGHAALMMVVSLAGSSQLEITKSLVGYLDSLGLAKDSINYVPSSCNPDCIRQHHHVFPPSLFTNAVTEGKYGVAELLAPYVDHAWGYPSALFHILSSPGPRVLDHVEFLAELGPEHIRYACYPLYKRTVLQVAAMQNSRYESPKQLTDVLELLIERVVAEEEDIDCLDHNGATALFYAADYASPEAVQVLMQWGANPLRPLKIKSFLYVGGEDRIGHEIPLGQFQIPQLLTPYDYCLSQLLLGHYIDRGFGNFILPSGSISVNTSLPIAKNSEDVKSSKMLRKFRTMAQLSSRSDGSLEAPATNQIVTGLPDGLDLSEVEISGLVPGTTNVWAQQITTRTEHETALPLVKLWGAYAFEGCQARIHIRLRDQTTGAEKARISSPPGDEEASVFASLSAVDEEYAYQFRIELADGYQFPHFLAAPANQTEEGEATEAESGLQQHVELDEAGSSEYRPDSSQDDAPTVGTDERSESEALVEAQKRVDKGKGKAVDTEAVDNDDVMRIWAKQNKGKSRAVDTAEETDASEARLDDYRANDMVAMAMMLAKMGLDLEIDEDQSAYDKLSSLAQLMNQGGEAGDEDDGHT